MLTRLQQERREVQHCTSPRKMLREGIAPGTDEQNVLMATACSQGTLLFKGVALCSGEYSLVSHSLHC